jgi:hypothetical protein
METFEGIAVLTDLPPDHPLIANDPENLEWNEAWEFYLAQARDHAGDSWEPRFIECPPRFAA